MFEKIGVYGLVFIANVVLNGAKKTDILKMWVIILKENHILNNNTRYVFIFSVLYTAIYTGKAYVRT
ncbi:hypothetical protein C9Z87_21760 [Escherichia coli]|nr:hypothetical protein [Escherichia coli]EIK99627.1 hypothetical protein ECO9340_16943 [Escherichia coli O103:H25 str. CVM9340]EYZ24311.1 hypothetical protein BX66_13640 [Escherichia coli O103:H25 str. 2010C-4529]EFI4191256.1 hypothetical protein [Escherichia coli]KPO60543.1 hypothetical protein ACU60_18835 [Escherichia coli]